MAIQCNFLPAGLVEFEHTHDGVKERFWPFLNFPKHDINGVIKAFFELRHSQTHLLFT